LRVESNRLTGQTKCARADHGRGQRCWRWWLDGRLATPCQNEDR
jgi:hypothetical protein